jgi:hypothetical protein
MKKLIFGCVSFFSGFIGLITISTVRALYPYSYSWDGLMIFFGFLSNSHMTLLFWICSTLCVVGGFISWSATFRDTEQRKSDE